ncbi:MAG: hypothetical protein Q9193_000884 [Seirophora villosa]
MARSKVKASQGLRGPSSEKPMTRKRARLEAEHDSKGDANDKRQPSSAKRQKQSVEEDPADAEKAIASSSPKERTSKPTAAAKQDSVPATVESLISKYGKLPLADLELPNPSESTPENVLALVYNAMLTSARISHDLAFKSVKCLVEAGYHDIATLSKSTWEERTEVLTKGGYTRYREKTATGLGELADFVKEKYGTWIITPERHIASVETIPTNEIDSLDLYLTNFPIRQRSQQPPKGRRLIPLENPHPPQRNQGDRKRRTRHLLRHGPADLALSRPFHRSAEHEDRPANAASATTWTRYGKPSVKIRSGCAGSPPRSRP